MIELCKHCANRCKMVNYDGMVLSENACFIQYDAGHEIPPHDFNAEYCDYFEERKITNNQTR